MIEQRRMSQDEFINAYNDAYRPHFNPELFKRDDMETVELIKKVILSCERDRYFTLKVLSMRLVTGYEEMYDLLRDHEQSRLKSSKSENVYDYIQLRDSDFMILEVKYLIRKNGVDRIKIDNKEVAVENPEQVLTVLIAIPRFVDKYYYRLTGNYYAPVTQLVDASTYNNTTTNNSKYDSVFFKTLLMKIQMIRQYKDVVDVNTGQVIRAVIFTSNIFKTYCNPLYYIFAKYGYYVTTEMFGLQSIIVDTKPVIATSFCNEYVSFKKHNLYISCPKMIFEEHVAQTMCLTIYDAITKDTTIDDIYSTRFWLITLGGAFRNYSVEKGLCTLDSLESVYDLCTKEELKLPDRDKENIYLIIKWAICEFSALRSKDNTDVSIKRRRMSECIAHVYATKLSRGIHRICDLGKKVKLKNIVSAVYTSPMYIISTIVNMSNVFTYVDTVNDNDALMALKFTYKGISGLGEEGGSVQDIYKHVDPTSIGIIDPDTSSASDPGMSGMLCPLGKTYGGFFREDFKEPNEWNEHIAKLNAQLHSSLNRATDIPPIESYSQYDYIKERISRESMDINRNRPAIIDLDGVIDYSGLKQNRIIRDKVIDSPKKSLFTVIEDNEETE